MPRWRPLWLAASLLLGVAGASAQDIDPPGRVARLNLLQGTVSQLVAGDNNWNAAEINRPLTTGDRLHAEPGARLELHSGSSAVRLEGPGTLDISQLDDNTTRLTLGEGKLNLRVRNLYPGEQMEIDTPNLALTVQQPGSFSLEVDARTGTTRVAARYGNATVYGENAESLPLSANGQQFSFAGRNLAQTAPPNLRQNDGFDLWADARDRAEDQSISARYVSRDIPGYQQLDSFGDWQNDTTYGAVWIPRITVAEWAPYRYGQWRWIAPWGWTWVDDAPWGFAPFHYGRWAQIGPRWAWVPGPKAPRPTYAPALVGFLGGQPGRADWNIHAGPDHRPGPGIGWFPLAPGEAWRPGFNATPRYLDGINRDGRRRGDDRPYFFQGRPNAVTAVPQVDFGRGPAWRPNRPNLRDGDLAGAQLLPAPPMPGVRPGNDRPQWNGPARSQAEQAQRAQIQADQARQRQQEAQQRPSQEFQAQQDRLQRENQMQQLQQRQQFEQQQRQQQQWQQQRDLQRNQIDPPHIPIGRPPFQQADGLRREQQAQQERLQRDTAQREQIQRQQQLQQREQQNQQEQQRARQQAQQAEQSRREQQAQQERMQRDVAQREQLQRQQQQQQQQLQRPQFQQSPQPNQIDPPGVRGQPQAQPLQGQPMPRQNPQMLPGNNRDPR
ncbi:hypothetical protein RD110_09875 [Rhodoferax koreense]|uniref:Chromosome partitioning protein ParA n=1 Tax=Rhodoferax koreensis TaxID=1842727 RepID=A0A1P8K3M8_9BURK|nr:DUF6600 domain-containing protein [Rhodoferax koreense]APW40598.1 hypothetical protein RD110_09875 [Rhodoferax koreense]